MKAFIVSFCKIALGVLILGALGLPARANLISNGSFETPVVPTANFSNFNIGSTAITGWTVVGPQVSIVSGSFSQGGLSFPAENGNQWLDLTGDGANAVEGVEQVLATTIGQTYTVSFWVGNVVNVGGIFGTTSTVAVQINGTTIDTATNSMGTGLSTQVWEQFTTSFVASSSSTILGFLNEDPSSDNSNGLDNIVVTAGASSATPEPSSLLLLGTGLLGLAALRKQWFA